MSAIMSDNDVRGHFEILVRICRSDVWSGIWDELAFDVVDFESLGLSHDAADVDIWRACQASDVLLITGNRSSDRPDALEATIRALANDASLPVVTLASPLRVLREGSYAEETVERLMEILIDLEEYRGTGRLFIP